MHMAAACWRWFADCLWALRPGSDSRPAGQTQLSGRIDLNGYVFKPKGSINAAWRWLTESLLAVRLAKLFGALRAIQAIHSIDVVADGRALRMIDQQRL